MKKNPQSGQTGFLIILLMSALLIVAISTAVAVSQNAKRTAEEGAGSRVLNLAESGTDLIIGGAIEGLKDLNFTESQINSSYTYQTDKGVIFPLPQGETIELNPSKNQECVNNSCVIGIWWNNNPTEIACDSQAALLVSEYSQDAGDALQTICNSSAIQNNCNGNASCEEFYSPCQPSDGSVDLRTGLSRERARFYLFRPAACGNAATKRQWDGYETAFGNASMTGACGGLDPQTTCITRSNMVGANVNCENLQGRPDAMENGENAGPESCTGTVQAGVEKKRQEYAFNPELSKKFANYYELPVFPNTTIVRIKALYADTEILVDLRGQITQGISTVTDGAGTQRSIEVKKTVPSVPSVLDYALFSGGGDIDKKATPDRD